MKRLAEFQPLSMQHHQGLVFARKVKKAAASGDANSVRNMWIQVGRLFETELEPHFRIEDIYIAPILEKHGETALMQRFKQEHRAIRRIFMPESGRTSADLNHFGELLERHIRFEEREFFETAQRLMSDDELLAIDRACAAASQAS
jgi:hemerythrin-like domain-containing protein